MFANMLGRKRDIVTKTDRGVKTLEAWWSFGNQLWEARGFVTPITLLAVGMTAALGKVFAVIASYGWAGWALAGVPTFVVVALVWFGISWLWYLRPGLHERRLASRQDVVPTISAVPDFVQMRKLVKEGLEESGIVSTFLTESAEKSRYDSEKTHTRLENLTNGFAKLRIAFDSHAAKCGEFESGVRRVFLAKRRIEILTPLYTKIEEDAARLEFINKKFSNAIAANYPEREAKWARDFDMWRKNISVYQNIADEIDATLPSALRTNSEDYRPDRWPMDTLGLEFSEEVRHDYKTYRLIRIQMEALNKMVMDQLRIDASL